MKNSQLNDLIEGMVSAGDEWEKIATAAGLTVDNCQMWHRYYILGRHETTTHKELAAAYGITRSAVKKRFQMMNRHKLPAQPEIATQPDTVNEKTIIHNGKAGPEAINNAEDFIKAMAIDTDVWQLVEFTRSAWNGHGRNSDGDLETYPLYSARGKVVAIEPVPINPTIAPVIIKVSQPTRKRPKVNSELYTAVIISDPQFGFSLPMHSGDMQPFHNRAALDLALQITRDIEPDVFIVNGDIIDGPEWSDSFIRSPEFARTMQPTIAEAAWWLAQYRRATPGQMIALDGNHDARLQKAIMRHIPWAYGLRAGVDMSAAPLLSVDGLLGLAQMGIEYVQGYPDSRYRLNDAAVVTHGDVARGGAGATTKAIIDKNTSTVFMGHIHRYEWAAKTHHAHDGPRTIQAVSFGGMCDGRHTPGRSTRQNWQTGFGVVNFNRRDFVAWQPVTIAGDRAFYGGAMYRAADQTPNIEADLGWDFSTGRYHQSLPAPAEARFTP